MLTGPSIIDRKDNPKDLKAYAFFITDNYFNPISTGVFLSDTVDAGFSKFNEEVNEITFKDNEQ